MSSEAREVVPAPDAGGRGRIRVLPEAVAARIAAGEVIERPASVVKELIENALDAGARRVTVELAEGGIALARVVDDGEGMSPEDAVLAFTRHATSKLADEHDLARITTLGFRGEALPSIAAIAAVELITRGRGAGTGVRVRVEGGAVVDVREAGAAPGTTVAVRELFAPVPARRKFLKSVATELGHVTELVARQALARPDVHLRLVHDGREVAVYPPVGSLAERVRQVLGAERARDARPFAEERLGIRVEGVALSPHRSFASGRALYLFVNGRVVRDRAVQHAVVEAYAGLVPRGRWPGAVVMLVVPPADVDVNVHPAKHEVRFRLARVVHDAVQGATRRALARAGGGAPEPETVAEALRRYATRGEREGDLALRPPARPDEPVARPPGTGLERGGPPLAAPGRAPAAAGFSALRFVGQIFRGYLVCEGADRLLLIDQHAAHERIAFERLRAQHRAGGVERQTLLLPVPVELDPRRAEALAAARERVEALGFDVEPFGERAFLVRAMPALLGPDDPLPLIEDLADALAELGSQLPAAEAIEALLGRIACHSVVRVGRALVPAEVERLLVDLDALAHGTNCPHGRPVSVEFTRGQLERMFGR